MRKFFWYLSFIVWILPFVIYNQDSYAQPISSTELIEKAKEYNNKAVEYQGEVVGDVMVRGDFAWMNLNDGKNAIGIWTRKDLIEGLIKYKGDYKYKGDMLLVKGIFHRACPEHGGDLDIHLEEAINLKEGFAVQRPISLTKIVTVAILFILALGLSALSVFRERRK